MPALRPPPPGGPSTSTGPAPPPLDPVLAVRPPLSARGARPLTGLPQQPPPRPKVAGSSGAGGGGRAARPAPKGGYGAGGGRPPTSTGLPSVATTANPLELTIRPGELPPATSLPSSPAAPGQRQVPLPVDAVRTPDPSGGAAAASRVAGVGDALAGSPTCSPGGNARARLEELLNKIHVTAPAEACVISQETRKLFERFIRGYAGTAARGSAAARRHQGSPRTTDSPRTSTHVEGATPAFRSFINDDFASKFSAPLNDDAEEEPARKVGPAGSAAAAGQKEGGGTHYDFFASLGVELEAQCNAQDRERCLRFRQQRNLKDRVALCAHGPGRASASSRSMTPRMFVEDGLNSSVGATSSVQDTLGSDAAVGKKKNSTRKSLIKQLEWRHDSNTAAVLAKEKAEMRTREACESLRFLVFGTEIKGVQSKDAVAACEQSCGTKEEVTQLQKVWAEMDEDGSGDVEFQEFLSFFSRSKADRLLGMRCVSYLVGKAKDEGVDEREMGCTVEDMMRLIWLRSGDDDIEHMLRWFREAEFARDRVPMPPLLPQRKKRAIMENFPTVNFKQQPQISFHELVENSFLDPATLKGLREQWAGRHVPHHMLLSEEDLLEMLCPKGYRAHAGVRTAVGREGEPLTYVENEFFSGWLHADRAAAAVQAAFSGQAMLKID